MQTTFRFRPSKPNIRLRDGHYTTQSETVRPRRAHKKSRLGCQNCKRRRVKCDENTQDGCRNCLQHGIECDYLILWESDREATSTSDRSLLRSPDATETPVQPLPQQFKSFSPYLHQSIGFPILIDDLPEDIVPPLQTMSFFEMSTCSTITSSEGLAIFNGSLLAIGHQRDYFMHAMLGMAAAHLRTMDTIAQDQYQVRRFQKTESYHWHHAIRLYRAELTNEAAVDHVDALITTCMLLGMHNFHVANLNETSFVNVPRSQRPTKLRWLSVSLGFVFVMRHVEEHISKSAWYKIFDSAVPAFDGWTVSLESANGIFADFLDLCDITVNNESQPNVYRDAVKDLFALLQLERVTMCNMPQVMAFMGRLKAQFQELLIERDTRALLILLYWFISVNRLGVWWATTRVMIEAQAIIAYLEFNGNARVQKMLTLPRIAFGFIPTYAISACASK